MFIKRYRGRVGRSIQRGIRKDLHTPNRMRLRAEFSAFNSRIGTSIRLLKAYADAHGVEPTVEPSGDLDEEDDDWVPLDPHESKES